MDSLTKKDIVLKYVHAYFNEQIKDVLKPPYDRKVLPDKYAIKIGDELSENNINFESLFDLGKAENFLPGTASFDNNDAFSKQYTERCKRIPSYEFLNQIIDRQTQKEILMNTLECINLDHQIERILRNFDVFSSALHLLKGFRDLGIDHVLINDELKPTVKKIYHHMKMVNAPIFFIHNDYYFDHAFINELKDPFFKSFTGNVLKNWNDLIEANKSNMINAQHNHLMHTISVTNDLTVQKYKI